MAYLSTNKAGVTKTSAPLQKYTEAQSNMICNAWENFEKGQKALAANSGMPTAAKEVAIAKLNGKEFFGNALTVPKDTWGQWAGRGIEVQRSNLAVFADLAATNSRAVPIGVLVDHFQRISDSSKDVNMSIDGRGKAKTSQPVLDYIGTPIPIYDNNCSFGWRQMETIMRDGSSNLIDAAQNNKIRHIAERLENMALYGEAELNGLGSSYGLLNHPQRNSRATGVTLNGATPSEWKAEIIATLKLNHGKNFKNGHTIYLNWDDYFYITSYQYGMATANGAPTATGATRLTIEQELLNIPGVERVVAADSIPANTIIALVKRTDVVEVLNAMPLSMRPKFRANPEDDYVFMNMTAQAVQLKYDAEDQMGLAVSS